MSENKFEISILEIPSDTDYWLIRAGSKAEFYEDFKHNNFIAVGSNDISLETLKDINKPYRVTDDILENKYKDIFFDKRLEDYKLKFPNENITDRKHGKDITRLKISSSHEATKAFKFVEKIKEKDIVIVPNEGSTHFLLGVVCSDVFEDEIPHVNLGFTDMEDDSSNFGYPISNFKKKRRVYWFKELRFEQIPDKMTWVKSTRQTIYNLNDYDVLINTLINSRFVYKDNFYYRIDVTTQKDISSYELFELQRLIVELSGEKVAKKIYQKTSVQSPGNIILQILSDATNIKYLLGIVAALVGDVEIKFGNYTFRIVGLLPRFLNRKHKNNILKEDERKQRLENDKLEEEVRGLSLDNDAKELEIQKNNTIEEIKKRISNLGLTNSDVGTSIPPEMQKHNLMYQKNSHEKSASLEETEKTTEDQS